MDTLRLIAYVQSLMCCLALNRQQMRRLERIEDYLIRRFNRE